MIKLLDELAAMIGAVWELLTWRKKYDPDVEIALLGSVAVFLFCVWYGRVAYTFTFGG